MMMQSKKNIKHGPWKNDVWELVYSLAKIITCSRLTWMLRWWSWWWWWTKNHRKRIVDSSLFIVISIHFPNVTITTTFWSSPSPFSSTLSIFSQVVDYDCSDDVGNELTKANNITVFTAFTWKRCVYQGSKTTGANVKLHRQRSRKGTAYFFIHYCLFNISVKMYIFFRENC